ncbi:hypothetical protein C7428_3522 [Pantoea ananatis]|nr:hypothetical protein C7428_3522 [Pantoea ananatis]
MFLIILLGSFCFFSKPSRIEHLNGWFQLVVSGGLLTPLVTYAWFLKGKFEKIIDNDGLDSIETSRLSIKTSLFIKKIWLWVIYYICSGAVIVLFNILKDDATYSRYLGSLSIALLFIALLSAISLRDFDVALSELKAAIIIRRKKNAEKEAMLKLLNEDDEFSQKEKDYFNRYNGNG